MKRGLFIVLDGIDGSGKTTQAYFLVKYLFKNSKKNHVFLTREPYISEHYEKIRELLKSGSTPEEYKEEFANLFLADRKVHADVIEALLQKGIHVVCDRYKYSTIVYQSSQGMDIRELIALHQGLPVPDLAVILDTPADVAFSRIHVDDSRTHAEFFEKADFLKKLREGYLDLKNVLKDENIVVVDGTLLPEAAFEEIKGSLEKLL